MKDFDFAEQCIIRVIFSNGVKDILSCKKELQNKISKGFVYVMLNYQLNQKNGNKETKLLLTLSKNKTLNLGQIPIKDFISKIDKILEYSPMIIFLSQNNL